MSRVSFPVPDRSDLQERVRASVEAFEKLPRWKQAELRVAQRRSWVIGEMMLAHPEMTRDEANALCDSVDDGGVLVARIEELSKALRRIERWFGEFPSTGRTWPDGDPMSYSTAYGSSGERDYMRGVAREALAGQGEGPKQ